MKYKLRAECSSDISKFYSRIHPFVTLFEVHRWDGYPDCDLVFETVLSLTELKTILNCIEDGHVMLSTVNMLKYYTGNYNVPVKRTFTDHQVF